MNELLGWYGFDGVDRLDLSTKNTRNIPSSHSVNNSLNHQQLVRRRNRNRPTTILSMQQTAIRNNNNNNNSNNNSGGSTSTNRHCYNNNNRNSTSNANKSVSAHKNSFHKHRMNFQGVGGGFGGNESTNSDHDTRSSREDDSKSPQSAGRTTLDEKIDFDNCCWCHRPVPENAPEFLTTSDGPRYCSESCFAQSRRACFKKAKTCDWCKHIRHAVSYVDFQDGASQLQFCSDKCLNQYKMQIFCKETQAHLDMNPHLRDQGLEAAVAGNGAGLITPELWLRNCRSRSVSPASTLSASPGPAIVTTITAPISRPSPPLLSHNDVDYKPLISVAPVSKLMSKSLSILNNNSHSSKHSRKKRSSRSSLCSTEIEATSISSVVKSNQTNLRQDINSLTSGNSNATLTNAKTSLSVTKANNMGISPGCQPHPLNLLSSSCSPSTKLSAPSSSLNQFVSSSMQDLQMNMPPLSPMLEHPAETALSSQTLLHSNSSSFSTHAGVGRRTTTTTTTTIPPTFFAAPLADQSQIGGTLPLPSPQLTSGFPRRTPTFLQGVAPLFGSVPRFMANTFPHNFQHLPPPHPLLQSDLGSFPPPLLPAPPPVTVMVPYPIIIPLPIPIPIPLPIIDFHKAYLTPEQRKKFDKEKGSGRIHGVTQKIEVNTEEETCTSESVNIKTAEEEPLDFTKCKNSPPIGTKDLEDCSSNPKPEPFCPVTEIIANDFATSCTATVTDVRAETSKNLDPEPNEDNRNIGPEILTMPSTVFQDDIDSSSGNDNEKEKMPKFKITRLHTKRALVQTKEFECSRPLRKRKRIIDCDFQKIALSNSKEDDSDQIGEDDSVTPASSATIATTCVNSQAKISNKKPST